MNQEEMERIYFSDDDKYLKPAWVKSPLFDLDTIEAKRGKIPPVRGLRGALLRLMLCLIKENNTQKEGEMKNGEKKRVCKCPACSNGGVYLIKRAEFKYDFQCDNTNCQTRRQRWANST